MELPSPSDRLDTVGILIGILGGVIGLVLILFTEVFPWGFVLLAVSGLVAFTSILSVLAEEWDRVP